MSRIGKIPVSVPKEVKVFLDNSSVRMEGTNGKVSMDIPWGIKLEHKEDKFFVTREAETKQVRASHGTVRALLTNMLAGVTKGHRKDLEIQGIGFRAQIKGTKLVMNLGFSHPVEYEIPKEVKISVPTPTSIVVEGIDKVSVGNIAAVIRDFKRPEPYKGKGIRYLNEVVRRKQGKSVTK